MYSMSENYLFLALNNNHSLVWCLVFFLNIFDRAIVSPLFSLPLIRTVFLGNILQTYLGNILQTCLGNILQMCLGNILQTCLGNILQTCLGNILQTCLGHN